MHPIFLEKVVLQNFEKLNTNHIIKNSVSCEFSESFINSFWKKGQHDLKQKFWYQDSKNQGTKNIVIILISYYA